MTNTRCTLAATALMAAVLLTSGCASMTEPWNDAPIVHKDDTGAEVYSMPDGFANVASKCDRHGNRIFTTREGGKGGGKDVAVIAQDPTCAKAAR